MLHTIDFSATHFHWSSHNARARATVGRGPGGSGRSGREASLRSDLNQTAARAPARGGPIPWKREAETRNLSPSARPAASGIRQAARCTYSPPPQQSAIGCHYSPHSRDVQGSEVLAATPGGKDRLRLFGPARTEYIPPGRRNCMTAATRLGRHGLDLRRAGSRGSC